MDLIDREALDKAIWSKCEEIDGLMLSIINNMPKVKALDYGTLYDWYISSVDDEAEPKWTPEHIEELLNDFYVIPKQGVQ